MGILKTAADTVYTFRFLALLVTPFEKTKAFEAGIIDEKGKKNKNYQLNTVDSREAYRNYYTKFHRLVFNIKKLIPAGRLGTYAAALYLLKDHYSVSEIVIKKGLKSVGVTPDEYLIEENEWFLLEDGAISPGLYRVKGEKALNLTGDNVVRPRDQIRIGEDSFPVGDLFGINIYEATHIKSNQKIYVTTQELT
jgi:hypothetical protein